MLQHLIVKNLAIVEEAGISFGEGLNVITGETGAGKSVLMGALKLVLGERADKSAIRSGADEGRVEAAFILNDTSAIDAELERRDIPLCEEGQLLIKRTVSAKGAGRTSVNDSPVTVQTLRTIAPLLIDIHGPYDQQSLLKQEFQRSLLDAYGNCTDEIAPYRQVWDQLRELEKKLHELTSDTSDTEEEIDRLNFIINEIKNAELTDADEYELVEEHAQSANAGEILTIGSQITDALIDEDLSSCSRLQHIQAKCSELVDILPEAEEWSVQIQSAILHLQEVGSTISNRLSRIEADPAKLQYLEDRMALVQGLKRKYGGSVEAVNKSLETYEARLDDLVNRSDKIEDVRQKISTQENALKQKAAILTESRRKAASKLAKAITETLSDLGFPDAVFDIALQPCTPTAHGADEVVFEFAPNPGEPQRPLRSIASSGEIARIMLAVKAVLAAHDSIPILVFDEIDANIGGEIGRAVGQKLRHVAESHQVISITHLPQSAVYGEQHIKVFKELENSRTRMKAKILNAEERIDEIARMLGGKGLTSVIENHAQEMLDAAAGK
ncbi:MAG: DNA repair protein RecN [Kiritimatiellia bacterium]